MTDSVSSSTRALNTAIEGIKRAEASVDRAVERIQDATVVANNTVAREEPRDDVRVSDEAEVVAANRDALVEREPVTERESDGSDDLASAVVDLSQAKIAYLASLKAAQVTADVESDAAKLKRLV